VTHALAPTAAPAPPALLLTSTDEHSARGAQRCVPDKPTQACVQAAQTPGAPHGVHKQWIQSPCRVAKLQPLPPTGQPAARCYVWVFGGGAPPCPSEQQTPLLPAAEQGDGGQGEASLSAQDAFQALAQRAAVEHALCKSVRAEHAAATAEWPQRAMQALTAAIPWLEDALDNRAGTLKMELEGYPLLKVKGDALLRVCKQAHSLSFSECAVRDVNASGPVMDPHGVVSAEATGGAYVKLSGWAASWEPRVPAVTGYPTAALLLGSLHSTSTGVTCDASCPSTLTGACNAAMGSSATCSNSAQGALAEFAAATAASHAAVGEALCARTLAEASAAAEALAPRVRVRLEGDASGAHDGVWESPVPGVLRATQVPTAYPKVQRDAAGAFPAPKHTPSPATPKELREVHDWGAKLREQLECVPQGTPLWCWGRYLFNIGSSSAAKVLGHGYAGHAAHSDGSGPASRVRSQQASLLKDMLWPKPGGGFSSKAMQWGVDHEPVADACLEGVYAVRDSACTPAAPPNNSAVMHAGLIKRCAVTPYAAVSVDGIALAGRLQEGAAAPHPESRPWLQALPRHLQAQAAQYADAGLVEHKCPQRMYRVIPPAYYDQIQLSMALLQLPWADFTVWRPDTFTVLRFPFNAVYARRVLLPAITWFYETRFAPALLAKHRGQLPEGSIQAPGSPSSLQAVADALARCRAQGLTAGKEERAAQERETRGMHVGGAQAHCGNLAAAIPLQAAASTRVPMARRARQHVLTRPVIRSLQVSQGSSIKRVRGPPSSSVMPLSSVGKRNVPHRVAHHAQSLCAEDMDLLL